MREEAAKILSLIDIVDVIKNYIPLEISYNSLKEWFFC